jgi:hypothetical protein
MNSSKHTSTRVDSTVVHNSTLFVPSDLNVYATQKQQNLPSSSRRAWWRILQIHLPELLLPKENAYSRLEACDKPSSPLVCLFIGIRRRVAIHGWAHVNINLERELKALPSNYYSMSDSHVNPIRLCRQQNLALANKM